MVLCYFISAAAARLLLMRVLLVLLPLVPRLLFLPPLLLPRLLLLRGLCVALLCGAAAHPCRREARTKGVRFQGPSRMDEQRLL